MTKLLRFIVTILAVGLNGWPGYADENLETFSLMYTTDECQYVQRGRQSSQVVKPTSMVTMIQLQGVAYINPKRWTVWINNERIDPDHPHPDIDVVSVAPTKISVALKHKLHSAVVELHINQSLDLSKIHYVEQENLNSKDETG